MRFRLTHWNDEWKASLLALANGLRALQIRDCEWPQEGNLISGAHPLGEPYLPQDERMNYRRHVLSLAEFLLYQLITLYSDDTHKALQQLHTELYGARVQHRWERWVPAHVRVLYPDGRQGIGNGALRTTGTTLDYTDKPDLRNIITHLAALAIESIAICRNVMFGSSIPPYCSSLWQNPEQTSPPLC